MKFNNEVINRFLDELYSSNININDKSSLIVEMLNKCSFKEQENLSALLKKEGFLFNFYKNPTPVTVALIPVDTISGIKLLSIVRNINPQRGGVGLPGGFVDYLETFEQAAARETLEETGLHLNADYFTLMASRITPQNNTLVFCNYNEIVMGKDIDLTFTNEETQKVLLTDVGQQFCFPTHTEMSDNFWNNLRKYISACSIRK
ncbi:NUDIX domain-containing protein [archaeon]|nr:NUDIX domain-containing protein [archaeon]NCQ51942.1 NUDIX domain-containing protein [archaeon]